MVVLRSLDYLGARPVVCLPPSMAEIRALRVLGSPAARLSPILK
jgi:hypothetical protein